MSVLNSLKLLEKIETYSESIQQLVYMESVTRSGNSLSTTLVEELGKLESCATVIQERSMVKFALNGSSSFGLGEKIKDLFSSLANPIPKTPEINHEALSLASDIISGSRNQYISTISKIKELCAREPLTQQYSKEELQKASMAFRESENKITGAITPENLEMFIKEKDKALDTPIFQNSSDLMQHLAAIGLITMNTQSALEVIKGVKEELIVGSQSLNNYVKQQITLENTEMADGSTKKYEDLLLSNNFSLINTHQRIAAFAEKYKVQPPAPKTPKI